MKVKALNTFVGAISMTTGEVREIKDLAVVEDLIRVGYVEEVKDEKEKKKKK